jgi:hypothetical protein
MDQTPPEKMIEKVKELRDSFQAKADEARNLSYDAGREGKSYWIHREDEKRNEETAEMLQSVILHLEGAQADKGWQPIETAPRDGAEILGWREDCGTLLIRWTSPAEFLTQAELDNFEGSDAQQEDWFCADFVHGSRLEREEVPTHWRSIPEPPDSAMAAQTEGERP